MSVNQSGGFFKGNARPDAAEPAALLQSAVIPDSEEQHGESRTRAVFGFPARIQSVPADEPRIDRNRVEPRGRRGENPHQRAHDRQGHRRGDPGLRTRAQGDGGAGIAQGHHGRGDVAGTAGAYARRIPAVFPRAVGLDLSPVRIVRDGAGPADRRSSTSVCGCTASAACGSWMRRSFRTSRPAISTRRR